MFHIPHRLEPVCSFTALILTPGELIGVTAAGLRGNTFAAGGEVTGERLRGRIRPGSGGDWWTVRTDGVMEVDARLTIETLDAALVYVSYRGIIDLGPDGYRQRLAGDPIPDGLMVRTNPVFQTSHPDHAWLHRVHCVGIGQILRSRAEVRYDVYVVR
jgi:hypothetical protein